MPMTRLSEQMRIHRSINEPRRQGLTFDEKWRQDDRGLITCWEIGRDLREHGDERAKRADKGELPILPYKGGRDAPIKAKRKYGVLSYYAMWLGLRGEDLDVDPDEEVELTCTKTGNRVVFTLDYDKYKSA
ncbi:hypothetical protein [Lentisalinibacter salinarum]|uniref:hypothetical protein n=1 Tax=Lentisalinibacter salinarum TaxID=2992239 RepID=UPI00386DB22A